MWPPKWENACLVQRLSSPHFINSAGETSLWPCGAYRHPAVPLIYGLARKFLLAHQLEGQLCGRWLPGAHN